ncbi:hypothetical protein PGT21_036098 [Puccinia graminis f. sp. tritici]|uniref:Uncharacterized protein n=1 Tax=Puccinia graminis f. sp. tritici TaxID=56615 RepID=A0A5B0PK96_PUCGR|nr:hypothetical protein PGT21_036098 [Puccinia graminis f. sp. tritici]KAA1100349.1 hypothetical protein PGTUg99_021355 [Puccinia graminis f. sp. tritici]
MFTRKSNLSSVDVLFMMRGFSGAPFSRGPFFFSAIIITDDSAPTRFSIISSQR